MTSTISTTRTAEEQLHWDSIMDVLNGYAPSLSAAKAVRQSPNFLKATRLGLVGPLALSFAQDPLGLFLMENLNHGIRWGDLELDFDKHKNQRLAQINVQLEALRRSGKTGRWREAAALYAEQASLTK